MLHQRLPAEPSTVSQPPRPRLEAPPRGPAEAGGAANGTAEPSTGLALAIPALCALCLLWPAAWNGYPLVFADTGTYLSQAMHRYLGWDRPVFYSLAILPLHLGLDTRPVVLAQSAVAIFVLDLTRRAFRLPLGWLAVLTLFLADCTALPWFVSELMPDLLTPLAILSLGILVFAPAAFRPGQLWTLTALAAFAIAAQQSSVPLSCAMLGLAVPARFLCGRTARWLASGSARDTATQRTEDTPTQPTHRASAWGARAMVQRGRPFARPRASGLTATMLPLLAPCAAVAAMMSVNAIGLGRVSISPFGNVFLLARVVYDGPGMDVLRRDCPTTHWGLCPYLDRFPSLSDEFLWNRDSPIVLAGGHKAVSRDAGAIVAAAVRAEPSRILRAAWDNTLQQLTAFATGDGLEPWPDQVGTRIDRDFPAAEQDRYRNALQQRGALAVPPPLQALHRAAALGGIAAALALLPLAWRRHRAAALFLALSLSVLPASAAITGALSTPHDRYQSRVVWLPACVALLTAASLARRAAIAGGSSGQAIGPAGPWMFPATWPPETQVPVGDGQTPSTRMRHAATEDAIAGPIAPTGVVLEGIGDTFDGSMARTRNEYATSETPCGVPMAAMRASNEATESPAMGAAAHFRDPAPAAP